MVDSLCSDSADTPIKLNTAEHGSYQSLYVVYECLACIQKKVNTLHTCMDMWMTTSILLLIQFKWSVIKTAPFPCMRDPSLAESSYFYPIMINLFGNIF